MKTQKIVSLGLLILLLCGSVCISGSRTDASSFYVKDLVRVDITQGKVTLPRGVEVAAENQGEWVDIIIPRYRLQELTDLQLPYTVLISDMDSYDRKMAGSYHTFTEIESIMEGIATDYPSITSLYSIGTTYEGRSLWCLEISDNPGVDEGEPGVLFMGLHHAREWPTVEICLHIANNLTSLYSIDPTITDLVNNRRVWIIPCVNPDGYYYCHDQNHDWRKNRQYFPQYGTIGVDLNRNYDGSSDGDIWGAWGSIGSASVTHDPGDEVYCGPGPTSELEIQTIRDFFIEHDVTASISWHTYQQELYWPWGYTAEQVPDSTYISSVGTQIASRITRQSGSGTYTPQQAFSLYGTTGDNIDWEYGYSHYVLGRATFPFTIEACAEFHPAASYLNQICKENCEGGLYLVEEAQNIKDTVVPRVIPPILDPVPDDSDGNYRVSWQQQNPSADPDYFQLDEMKDLTILTDSAESGSDLWTLDGFTLSTARYNSGSHSYKSRQNNADVSSMTTKYPLPITTGMKLSFWCWYTTENNFDDAFVEVSTDGRSYDVLGIFTGSSGGWVYKEYDLSNYSGESLFIRFRYTTDSGTTNEGFYVDDIAPVADFGSITTLSSSIADTFYDITGKVNGTYYYRVKGQNSARGWGDFSTLEKIIVSLGGSQNDTTPPEAQITTPKENYLYLKNSALRPFFTTVILRYITIEVNTTDPSGIDRVEFYIDDKNVGSDVVTPYNWTWETVMFFRHTIKIRSYDTFGNSAEEELEVWKFF
jgi:carboxypeptidase T